MSESQDEAMVRSIERECALATVGLIPFVPLDRVRWLLAYGARLQTEKKELEEWLLRDSPKLDALDRLRAENERLRHVVDEQRKTGETVYPLSEGMDMVRELQRLRAENEKLYAEKWELEAERQRLMGRVEYEMNGNRATALTASEATKLLEVIDRATLSQNDLRKLVAVLDTLRRIAHPEPQEGN